MADRSPISLWDSTAEERPPDTFAVLPDRVELAIVGAGYTGLSTALHAAEADIDALVIEAETIGYGGSGRNAGMVNAGIWLPPRAVKSALGDETGGRFLKQFGDGPETVFNLIEKHQIRCDAVRNGSIHCAHAPAGLKDLEGRHADWIAMGAPVSVLSPDEVAEMTGSPGFVGGLLDRRAGTINPMGYAQGLARAADAAGAKIATGVRVTGLTAVDDAWRVETSQGTVAARYVVLGTNAYADKLWPGLQRSFTPIHYLQIATRPLGDAAKHILPGRQPAWTNATIMTSFRRDAAGRLILGTMGRVMGSHDRGLTRRWAERQAARLFPELGPVEFEEAWHGTIAMTQDHLPRIHEPAPGLFTPVAYNGRGITTGTIFGQAIAQYLKGADPNSLPLPMTPLAPESAATLRSRIYAMGFAANQAVKGVFG